MQELPLKPMRDEFRELCKHGNLVPVYTDLIADAETPVSAFQKIDDGNYSFLLESAEKVDQVGRYSFVGSSPRIIFENSGRSVRIHENGNIREFEAADDPLDELQKIMSRFRPVVLSEMPPFAGGAVGYIAYDTVRHFEPTVPEPPPDDLKLPEIVFMVADTLLIFDHRLRRLRMLANAWIESAGPDAAYDDAAARIQALLSKLDRVAQMPVMNTFQDTTPINPRSNTKRDEYLQMVRDAKEYIRAGDVLQIVPSQRFEIEFTGDALTLYRALRFVNPSPYMFCIRLGDFALVGSSPEVHVRAMNGRVEIRPIAGTRRRGETEEDDERNVGELLADPKERAEHIMLVDLARNDVGRIAEFNSVRVTDLMTIEKYSHVMHIVSHVTGQLKPEKNAYDVMRATFPAGTVSGSPKVRAMQIINQLEKNKRGPYSGAVGYFGFDGNLDSCIALRTVVLKDGKAYVQAGGGVVADSTPEGEYQETVNKAMGMMRALAMANAV